MRNLVAHHHHPLDGLAAGQELGLAQDRRAAPAGVTAVTATLPLGLQPGGTADALDLVGIGSCLARPSGLLPRGPFVHNGVRRIVGCDGLAVVAGAGLAPPPAPAPTGRAVPAGRLVVPAVLVGGGVGIAVLGLGASVVVGVGVRLTGALTPAAAATATASPPASAVGGPVGLIVVPVPVVGVLSVFCVAVLDVVGVLVQHDRAHLDGLRCDEQREVVGRMLDVVSCRGVLGGFQQ